MGGICQRLVSQRSTWTSEWQIHRKSYYRTSCESNTSCNRSYIVRFFLFEILCLTNKTPAFFSFVVLCKFGIQERVMQKARPTLLVLDSFLILPPSAEKSLKELMKKRRDKVEEIKKKTNYYTTRDLIQKYDESSPSATPLRPRFPPNQAPPTTPQRPAINAPANGNSLLQTPAPSAALQAHLSRKIRLQLF